MKDLVIHLFLQCTELYEYNVSYLVGVREEVEALQELVELVQVLLLIQQVDVLDVDELDGVHAFLRFQDLYELV